MAGLVALVHTHFRRHGDCVRNVHGMWVDAGCELDLGEGLAVSSGCFVVRRLFLMWIYFFGTDFSSSWVKWRFLFFILFFYLPQRLLLVLLFTKHTAVIPTALWAATSR